MFLSDEPIVFRYGIHCTGYTRICDCKITTGSDEWYIFRHRKNLRLLSYSISVKRETFNGKPVSRKKRQEFVNSGNRDENPVSKIGFLFYRFFPYRKTIDRKNSRDEKQDYIRMTDWFCFTIRKNYISNGLMLSNWTIYKTSLNSFNEFKHRFRRFLKYPYSEV